METTELSIYNPRCKAYEFPELFEPVDLGLNEDDGDDEPKDLGRFVLPVCIEAVPIIETDVLFIVKERNEKVIFEPRKAGAMLFNDTRCAEKYIREVLKPKYGEKWAFVLWSYSALIK